MRLRLLAGGILIVFLGLPLLFYWYFFNQKASGITFSSTTGQYFRVRLEGKLSSSWLPLADKFLVYEKDCYQSCQFLPIPPIQYKFLMTSTGYVDIYEQAILSIGEKRTIPLTFHKDLVIHDSTGSLYSDSHLGDLLIDNAHQNFGGEFVLIGVTEKNRVYALKRRGNLFQLGILSLDKFTPLRNLPLGSVSVKLDKTKKYFLISFFDGKSLAISVTMDNEIDLPLIPNSLVKMGDTWKLGMSTGTYLLTNGYLQLNPRFSDFIDISEIERIGYIRGDDKERLSLSHFPYGQSVLIFLDRGTGESYIIKKDLDVQTLFFHEGQPAYIDSSGKVWIIDYKT